MIRTLGRPYVRAFRTVATLSPLVLLLAGCPTEQPVPDGPGSTPMNGPVRPGATCEPSGVAGTAADGTPMVCGTDGTWRMAVRSS